MKKLKAFFPPLFSVIALFTIVACEYNPENPQQENNQPNDSIILDNKRKDPKPEIEKSDSAIFTPQADSLHLDTLKILKDSLPLDKETHVIPAQKPAFKVFFKYMKLHNRGPIV